ncbi:tRNA (cytosine(38)-C(5))-methyltransferase [Neodiprion pinetum]|uniref:tRNA (cytosine(38)-C(5))-methyltransferase n=1 Tax=Neodiprion pinetum TaxID=441929 RepID=UPI00076FA679|nr:tRNA (cytosine(38)-C(5))-methyltransferase [Neodiprion pinetum]XP_046606111.1 tRNA (cytosine(38)-C(5))-methyltransferase [Neodiprion virginianus]
MKVLELYSGVGGMHFALRESGIQYNVLTSIDINTAANEVYRENFPDTVNLGRNIQSFDIEQIRKLSVDTILMSPPCQPFTRVGLKKDILDNRTDSFLHVLELIPQISTLNYILVENVKGFETSQARDKLVECIVNSGFNYKEFLLSPCQFGIPNTRQRYYMIAKRKELQFFFTDPSLTKFYPKELLEDVKDAKRILNILEDNIDENNYLISTKILAKHAGVLDIRTAASTKSCCFTKAYGRYAEGTGSVFCPMSEELVSEKYLESKMHGDDIEKKAEVLNSLKLRYFTPREIARLMCFPEDFHFPKTTTTKQKYRLLGNSINVFVVCQLIKLLKYGDADALD